MTSDCSVVQIESRYEDVSEFCENLYSENIRSPYLLAFMIDILEERLETKACQDCPQTLQRAMEVVTTIIVVLLVALIIIECKINNNHLFLTIVCVKSQYEDVSFTVSKTSQEISYKYFDVNCACY